jgi:hypothetical protein
MKKFVAAIAFLSIALCLVTVPAATAQDAFSSSPSISPPPLPPLPPPKIEIPRIPKMDEIPTSPTAPLAQRRSFNDRVTDCIAEGTAAGLGPNERSAYSAACANSR